MKKNNTLGIITAGVVAMLAAGCNDFLDLKPKSDLTMETFWKTENDANVGVIAIYNGFSKAMALGLWYWGEVRADNYDYFEKDALDQRELIENNISFENPAAIWTDLYDVIGKANAAIKYIPRIEMTPSLRNHYLSEAYAMRAWAYFYCIRVWGDVPLFLEPIEVFDPKEVYRERSSKDYIVEQVILPDLEMAYYLVNRSETNRKRMNVGTICMLMMDVYAWLNDYNMVIKIKEERVDGLDAAAEGNSANNWKYLETTFPGFIANWRGMFIESPTGEISKEVWFKLAYDRYGNGTHRATTLFVGSTSKLTLSNKLRGTYSAFDNRARAQWENRWNGYHLSLKFWPDGTIFSGDGMIDSDNDLVLYRYADAVLLYAEALCMVGRETDAVTELNKTYMRAGNPGFIMGDFDSSDKLLDAILKERQREFVAEGKRWFDLVRTGKWREHSSLTDEVKILFPIHRSHLLQNPTKLKQNDGYPTP